jgi:PAS domain S-box-containing protein
MSSNNIQFSISGFGKIFPFFFLLDKDLRIIERGSANRKIFPEIDNLILTDVFLFKRPSLTLIKWEQLVDFSDQLILLEHIKNKVTLRGQFSLLPCGTKLLFAGAPWFEKVEQLQAHGLLFSDYAPHNPHIDLLHVVQSQQISNDELKQVLEKINLQKNELIHSNQAILKVRASLEESNKRYEFVNKATSEAIWDWNILTGDVYYGDGFQKLFGYEPAKMPKEFANWQQRIHPEDYERVHQHLNYVIDSTGLNWEDEYRYFRKDGSVAYVHDKGFVVRDDYGHAIRMVGAMLDVTRRKNEEQHLLLLESVITHTNDSVLITKAEEGNPIIYVNKAFTNLTGYSLEEVRGKNPKIFQGPNSDKEAIQKLSEALRAFQSCDVTTINYKKNGEEYWTNFSVTPVFDREGICTHWISVQKDMTELNLANKEILNQKKFTEDILNNIPTDIAVFDPEHNYIYINPYAIQNKEMRSWLIGKNDFDYAHMRKIDDTLAKKRWELFEECVENKKTVQWIDEHVSKEGKRSYVLRNFYPFFENNRLKFVIGYGIDITERKLIENKLNEALDTVKKSNDELEQFAYVASHDLQEPLRMVTSFLTQLEKKYGDTLDDRAKEYIFYAVDGAKRMRQIILDLLEFSRAGKVTERMNDVDIQEVISDIEVLHSQQIHELNATIIKNNLPVIQSHKVPLRQIFQNLIGNSLKYHRKGISPIIEIKATSKEKEWEFCITDNGIGIESQYFQKIFVIFQRLHNRDEFSGTGIGLAITKKIIESMGGKIQVESVYGEGSTFCFTIPVKPTV